MEATTVILIALTAPAALLIAFFTLYELYTHKKIQMVISIILAAIAALFERLEKKYEKAAKELERDFS